MKNIKRTALVVALLTTAACTNTGGLFGGGNGPGANGAGSSTIEQTSLTYFQQTIGDTVLFAVDRINLGNEAIAILDAQAAWLNANPTAKITIEGHADEQGTRDYNMALGARRASAVREYLVAQGVADSRISVISYGKERPLAICSNESCWSKNRRAVTIVTSGAPLS